MRTLSGVGAVVLGVVGTLVCVAAVAFGWWLAVRTDDRVTRAATRLDQGLAEADARLTRVEERVAVLRTNLDEIRQAAARIAADNPDLLRVRVAVELLFARLRPLLERADAIAESLRSTAAGVRTAADVVEDLGGDAERIASARDVADTIDRAAAALHGPRARVDALKSATAVVLTRELLTLAGEAAAGSEMLAESLALARREIVAARGRTAEWRDRIVFWTYAAAAVNTLVWLWGGLGQVCLIGWGRRRFVRQETAAGLQQ